MEKSTETIEAILEAYQQKLMMMQQKFYLILILFLNQWN